MWAQGIGLLALAAIWVAIGAASADTRTGTEAFQRGDFATALEALTPEARKNDPAALYTLGRMHSAGLGVPADKERAAALLQRAAELGHAGAQHQYGAALALGDGVEQDIGEGLKWLMIAARSGNDTAREYAEQLARHMPRATISEIRQRAAEWVTRQEAASAP